MIYMTTFILILIVFCFKDSGKKFFSFTINLNVNFMIMLKDQKERRAINLWLKRGIMNVILFQSIIIETFLQLPNDFFC
jgi:uncharacterized membrane protein YbaN (DUF454 family)